MTAAARTAVPTRTILLWCPDWPIIAARRAHEASNSPALPADAPLALIERGEVFACSATARREGVRRGQRVRDAQARCPALVVLPYEEQTDLRFFEPVLETIEETMPGVQVLRPGTCAMRARGPARYYGSEEEAALWLLDAVEGLGIPGARVGIADGPFTAEHAARAAGSGSNGGRIRIVAPGDSAAFLSPLPIGVLGQPTLGTLLRRLGIRTLGQFAALGRTEVEARFGETGAHLHALAGGLDSAQIVARIPPEELDSIVAFEPPLDRIEQVAFGFRAAADEFIAELVRAQLVCTAIRVEIDSESGELSERSWLHPRSFTAADVVDRLRWQLQGSGTIDSGLSSGITRVRVVPEAVDAIGNHEQGLWGTGHDERIHHGLSRVQSMLGHGGVLTAALEGGRTLLERQSLAAWGDRQSTTRSTQQPWPGKLPPPTPSTVLEVPMPAMVLDAAGLAVDVDTRGMLSADPVRFSADGRTVVSITAWAGPWPIAVRWWDAAAASSANRFQVVDDRGAAWLLVLDDHRWWVEAQYD
jgi:protein ImuB